jgi:Fe-S-cluster containining protein
MLREVDLEEISDGKLYDGDDLVKLGTEECKGCHACCCSMADTIFVDPYDVCRLEAGLGMNFGTLLERHLELRVADGVILPGPRADKKITIGSVEESSACTFLNEEGRCSVHGCRPAICRLFPLGRVYPEEGGHKYFLQTEECLKERRTKIKIKKWMDTPEFARYEEYVDQWHGVVRSIAGRAGELPEEQLKQLDLLLLKIFFLTDYDPERDFYEQFEKRVKTFREVIGNE